MIKKIIKQHSSLFSFLKKGVLYYRYIYSFIRNNNNVYKKNKIIIPNIIIEINQYGCHCFFGYYDKSPMNRIGSNVLFLRAPQKAKESQMIDVCIYDMEKKEISKVGETQTWNWQQGAMEQWVSDYEISYNIYDGVKGSYQTVRMNIETKQISITPRAAYFYNKDFTKYLSLNFYRLDLYAKGYGYPYQVDSLDADKDGIWEVDVIRNTSKLILSLKAVMEYESRDYMQCQHYINHVAYTPDEQSIIFIHRWQVKGGEFVSRLLKYDFQNQKLISLLDNGHVSHYCWKSDKELLIYATNSLNEKGYMIVNILTGDTSMVAGLPDEDGHPSYSNDGKWILTDTYPDNRRDQYLFLFNTERHQLYKLDQLHSPLKFFNENRCDFHPRWSVDNKYVMIDNTDKGFRTLKIYKL